MHNSVERAMALAETMEYCLGTFETFAEENNTSMILIFLGMFGFQIDAKPNPVSKEYSHMSATLVNENGDTITLRTIDNVIEFVCNDDIIYNEHFSHALSDILDIIGRQYFDFINQ